MPIVNGEASGSFQRPGVVDYLLVVENRCIDIDLRIWVGALEVGLVGLVQGRVHHAELPGTVGDAAFGLLARLPARVTPEPAKPREGNVRAAWRELVDESSWGATAGRLQRLAAVRAELLEFAAEFDDAQQNRASRTELDETGVRARRLIAEMLDWAAIEAYLRGECVRAHLLLADRERVLPGDVLCAANRERLRLRLLEDEIEASVREAGG